MADIRLLGSIYVRNKPVPVGKNVGRYKADAPIICATVRPPALAAGI